MNCNSCCNGKNSVTAAIAFVDLATFDELSAYFYGGQSSITYFVRSVLKSNWFSFVATCLRHVSGCADFGNDFSASVNRSGDYLLNVWLRVQVPLVAFRYNPTPSGPLYWIRWTHNFMHNLVKYVNITFNELKVHEFDSTWFDYHAALTVTASKQIGYDNMIGNISPMTGFVGTSATPDVSPSTVLGTGGYFNLPIPLFFSEDSGIALPVAAIPFNDIKINYCLRDWKDLIVVGQSATLAGVKFPVDSGTRQNVIDQIFQVNVTNAPPSGSTTAKVTYTLSANKPKLINCETHSHYAVVHNDERVLMGKAPRDMAINQLQFLQDQSFDVTKPQQCYDLRFSHAINLMVYGAKNLSWTGEHSQYSVWEYGTGSGGAVQDPNIIGLNGFDPIAHSQLIYENTSRFDMGSDYYSLVVPFFYNKVIPQVSGIHAMSYSLEMFSLDPKGSTGYSKLANVTIINTPSQAAVNAQYDGIDDEPTTAQTNWKFHLRARNHNIVRLSGGSLGLPVL